ncbi:putative sugar O-methyltransferase [Shewanella saliphila]|nr:putative sugar O-methyltransferase [Shewanella saliphila]MCL1099829.1 putative sugar O-methyltransferase [Shewanella saliphila]
MNSLVDVISKDMQNVEECYRPSHFWKMGSARLQDDLDAYGITHFRTLPSALSYFVPTYLFDGMINEQEKYKYILAKCREIVARPKAQMYIEDLFNGSNQARSDFRVYAASDCNRKPFTSNFSESNVGNPIEQFDFYGKKYSRSSLNYLLGINFLKKNISDINVNSVLEIGGGFGSLGEILISDERNDCFYMNVDIPPTCIFSTYYLQTIFGKDKVADYSHLSNDKLNISKLREQYKAAILCPWQLPKLEGELDLFVNFISFQEMEPHIVENYLAEVSRLKSRYVLLRNLREGKQVAVNDSQTGVKKAIKSGDYDIFLPEYQLVAVNVLPFGYETIDGFNSELRLYERKK